MTTLLAAQIFALLTAFGLTTCDAVARYGLRSSTPVTAIVTLAGVTILLYAPAAAGAFIAQEVNPLGFLILVCAGAAAPGLGGTFFYMSVQRIGMARTASFAGSSPLVALLIAVTLMGEKPGPWTYLGTGLIVGGVIVLSNEHRLAALPGRGNQPFWRVFILAASATLLFAVAAALRKVGVIRVPSLSVALCAASIGVLGATLFLHRFLPEGNRIRFTRQSVGWFAASGAINSLAHLSFFSALQRAPLSSVVSLAYVSPLFALGYSWLLFREVERLNIRVLAGALLICAGAVVVTQARG